MDKKTKIALGIGAAGVLGYLLLSGSGERGDFDGGGGGGGFEPLLEPKKVTTTSTSEDPGRTTNIYNLGGGAADPGSFFAIPEGIAQVIAPERIIERVIKPTISPEIVTRTAVKKAGGGYYPASTVPGYVPTGISKDTWTYTKKETAVQEAVSAGLPEHIAERELKHYDPQFYTSAPAPVKAPTTITTTKKSSTISTIKSVAKATIAMSPTIRIAKSVSSFISSWWR